MDVQDQEEKNELMHQYERPFLWIVLMVICMFTGPIFSHAASPSPKHNISIEPRWGYYVMDTSKFEESAFGRRYGILGGLKVNLEFPKQFLQIGVGGGYMREHEPNYILYNLPVEASLNLRFKFSPDQFIVPYIGGGVDYSYFKQNARFLDPNATTPSESRLHNHRSGYHMNAGFQILLNRLSPIAAQEFDGKFGVNASYMTFEVRYSDLSNFGTLKETETDLSGWFYYIGFLMEF